MKAERDFRSSRYHFSIVFPAGWKVTETVFGGIQAVLKKGGGKEASICIHTEEATTDHRRVLENDFLGSSRISFFQEKGVLAVILEQGKGPVGQEHGYWAEAHVSGFFHSTKKRM